MCVADAIVGAHGGWDPRWPQPARREAVTHDTGPLLIAAGAGIGMTTVITRRIAYLIDQDRARPEQILALTFTDKGAAEMEARVDGLVPYGYADVEIATFPCVRRRAAA